MEKKGRDSQPEMERLTVIKSFNRGLPPSPYTSFVPKRDASFSAYRTPDHLTSAPNKDVAAMADDSEISIFDAQKYFNESSEHQQQRESKRVAPVGSADLGRVGEHCESRSVARASSASSVEGYGRNYRARSFHATPTASSEASWNSQAGLLCNPPGTIGVSVRSIAREKRNTSRKWFFGRECPCSGKKAVEIQEKVSEPRSPIGLNHNLGSDPKRQTDRLSGNTLQKVSKKSGKSLDSPHGHGRDWPDRHDLISSPPKFPLGTHFPSTQLAHHRVLASGTGFSFPILSQAPPVKLVLTSERNPIPLDEPPRDSLEIFRLSDDCIPRKSPESIPPRIFSPNPATPDRRSFTFLASPRSRATAMDDDVASDASSDLFEIESFTTQTTTTTTTTTNYPMYHRHDSLDEVSRRLGYRRPSLEEPATPSVAPTECYEPSEASIDWSVTTAEGFDRGSVTNFSVSASDIVDDVTLMRQELQRLGNGGFNYNGGGGGRRRGSGMLMSCRCEKAVSVGPGPTPVKEGQGGIGGGPEYIGSSTSRHVSSRVGMVNRPPLARSHSARLSQTFAT